MPNYLVEFYAPPGTVSPSSEYAELVISADNEQQARLAADRIIDEEQSDIASFLDWKSGPRDAMFFTALDMMCINVIPTASNRVAYTAAHIVGNFGHRAERPRLCPVCGVVSIRQGNKASIIPHESGSDHCAAFEYSCDICRCRFWFSCPSLKTR